MSRTTIRANPPAAMSSTHVLDRWLPAAAVLGIGTFGFDLVFWPEITAAIRVWLESTAFNHCFLVLPVAAYIAWERRSLIRAACPRPAPGFAVLGLPLAVAWFFAERIGFMEARQLLAMLLFQLLFLCVLGPRVWTILSAPLLYLFFLIPVGEFLTPLLQRFTVHFITGGLGLLGIPNFSDGVTIEIPEGTFFVAEACAGLRFLIASIAFGTFYACIVYRTPARRMLFICLSVVVPIIANGVRALAIVAIAHWFGSQNAVATDHVFYGWLLFTIVTFVLILIGMPFRQKTTELLPPIDRLPSSSHSNWAGALALVTVLLLSFAPRALASYLDRAATSGSLPRVQLYTIPGCSLSPMPAPSAFERAPSTAAQVSSYSYRCGNDLFTLDLQLFRSRVGARAIFSGSNWTAVAPGWELIENRNVEVGAGHQAQHWFESEYQGPGQQKRITASAVWVGGRPAYGLEGRMRQMLNTLRSTAIPTIRANVDFASSGSAADAQAAMSRFLQSAGELPLQIATAADERDRE